MARQIPSTDCVMIWWISAVALHTQDSIAHRYLNFSGLLSYTCSPLLPFVGLGWAAAPHFGLGTHGDWISLESVYRERVTVATIGCCIALRWSRSCLVVGTKKGAAFGTLHRRCIAGSKAIGWEERRFERLVEAVCKRQWRPGSLGRVVASL